MCSYVLKNGNVFKINTFEHIMDQSSLEMKVLVYGMLVYVSRIPGPVRKNVEK